MKNLYKIFYNLYYKAYIILNSWIIKIKIAWKKLTLIDNRTIVYILILMIICILMILIFISTVIKKSVSNNNDYIIQKLNHYSAAFNKDHIGLIGSWGEDRLANILINTGFTEGNSFYRNKTFMVDNRAYRPDYVLLINVELLLIIDVKTPWISYNKYLNSEDGNKMKLLKEHANAIKRHIKDLSSKNYNKIKNSLPFIIMFIPLEDMFAAACKHEYSIADICKKNKIFIATPHTIETLISIISILISQNNLQQSVIKKQQDIDYMINDLDCLVSTLDTTINSLQKRTKEIYSLRAKINEEFISRLKSLRGLDGGKFSNV